MDDITLVTIIFITIGMAEILQGIPLLYKKIKPNWLFGFRLPSTVSNEEIWYKVNEHVGRGLVYAGSIVVIGSLFLSVFNLNLNEKVWILVIILAVPLSAVLISGFLYLKKIVKK